jgi:glycosyltransferase involved in cell wall biosynthesis
MELKKNIVLITPGQPSVNPRVVKEADALVEAGYSVTVLYCFWINWAQEADKTILSNAKWQYLQVGGTPNNGVFSYYLTKIEFKIYSLLQKYIGNKYGIAEKAQARCISSLLKAAKSIKADWYIGHNLGALSVVVKAAQYNNAKAGFDFEDYHRGESKSATSNQTKRAIYLENKYVSSLAYISTASPLITDQIKSDFPKYSKSVITVNNVFAKKDQPHFVEKSMADNTLQLFWFSQTVGTGRGIELVIEAIRKLNDKDIYLTLIGRYSQQVKEDFMILAGDRYTNINFRGIVDPSDIIAIGATMDVGLALEQTMPFNRNICLTNKIFTYLQTGNALILTNTTAQTKFQQQYEVGIICSSANVDEFSTAIKKYKQNMALLNKQKEKNWHLANDLLNWENESKKILEIIA